MADRLVIHGADLQEAYSRIVYLHGEFDSATARSDDAASYVGHPGLKSELENVAGSWRIHREKLLKSLEDIESQIKGTLDTFGDIDKKMADNLHPDAGPSGQGGGSSSAGGTTPQVPSSQPSPAVTPATQGSAQQVNQTADNSVQSMPLRTSDPTVTSSETAAQTTATNPGSVDGSKATGVDLSALPPELQSLVGRLDTLITSPEFVAKYPQFAAGAGLGLLLPLLLASQGSPSGATARGSAGSTATQSPTDAVRGLLDGVKKDMSDGHLDGMTPSQARAELDRLLGPGDGSASTNGDVAPQDTTPRATDESPSSGSDAPKADPSAAAAPAQTDAAPTPEASSGSAGKASPAGDDIHAGSPMLNANPDAVGQVPASDPAPGLTTVSDASPTSAIATGGTSTGTGSSAPISTDQHAGSGTSFGGATATAPASSISHDPTPMMSPGSFGSTGTGSASQGTSSMPPSQATSTISGSGTATSTSARPTGDKATESRKSDESDHHRTEGKPR